MSAERYRSGSQQTLLRAIEVLGERPIAGMTVDALTERLGCSRDQAYRAVKNLELAGWAEQPVGRSEWRLSARSTQLAERMRLAIADLHRAYLGDLA